MRSSAGRFISAVFILLLPVLPAVRGSEAVYNATLPATAWIKAPLGNGKTSYGSGVLVDAERRWVVTNYHVVEDRAEVFVFFPVMRCGQVIAERSWYLSNEGEQSLSGRVVARDAKKDVAIIELNRLPEGAKAVPMAARSPRAGQDLHVVGNPRGGALWVYTAGKVRTIFDKRWSVRMGNGRTLFLDARVVETSLAINQGDSGGPVVNNKNELVALVTSFQKDQRLVSTCIDISEIREILKQTRDKGVRVVQSGGGISKISTTGEKDNPNADARIAEVLKISRFRNRYRTLPDGTYKIQVNDISPVFVYIDSIADRYKGISVRQIYAVGKVYDKQPPEDLLLKLLQASASRKMGAWQMSRLRTGKHVVVFCHRLNVKSTPKEMEAAIRYVFEEADDFNSGKIPEIFGVPEGYSLKGTWNSAVVKKGQIIKIEMTSDGKKRMAVTFTPEKGRAVTLSGEYVLLKDKLSLIRKNSRENLGKLIWKSRTFFVLDEGQLKLQFKKAGADKELPPLPPPPIPKLADSKWSGSKTLQNKVRIQFKPKGEAILLDSEVKGKWTQNGRKVTITFPDAVYTGTITRFAITGTVRSTTGEKGNRRFVVERE